MAEAFTLQTLAVSAKTSALDEIGSKLESFDEDHSLFHLSDEDLCSYIVDQWEPKQIEWDPDRRPQLGEDEVIYVGRPPERTISSDIRRLYLPLVPKKSNEETLAFRPEQSWIEAGPSLASAAEFDRESHTIILRGTRDELTRLRSEALNIVSMINADIDRHFGDFQAVVLEMIKKRRSDIKRQQDAFERDAADLGVAIRRRNEAPVPIDVTQRAEVRTIRNLNTPPPGAPDPRLSTKSIAEIIELIDQAGKGFQVARREFRSLGEEGLRHVIAGYLNAVFGSTSATGETFSKDGRPDLNIMVNGRPVLVAECKFWSGSALYIKTLNTQLARYVLWQHTVAVMITFCTRQSMTKAIREAINITAASPQTRRPVQERSETYFVSHQAHPDDDERTIEIHHLFFNLYSTSDGKS